MPGMDVKAFVSKNPKLIRKFALGDGEDLMDLHTKVTGLFGLQEASFKMGCSMDGGDFTDLASDQDFEEAAAQCQRTGKAMRVRVEVLEGTLEQSVDAAVLEEIAQMEAAQLRSLEESRAVVAEPLAIPIAAEPASAPQPTAVPITHPAEIPSAEELRPRGLQTPPPPPPVVEDAPPVLEKVEKEEEKLPDYDESSALPPVPEKADLIPRTVNEAQYYRVIIQTAITEGLRSVLRTPGQNDGLQSAIDEIQYHRALLVSAIEERLFRRSQPAAAESSSSASSSSSAQPQSSASAEWMAKHRQSLDAFLGQVQSGATYAKESAENLADRVFSHRIFSDVIELTRVAPLFSITQATQLLAEDVRHYLVSAITTPTFRPDNQDPFDLPAEPELVGSYPRPSTLPHFTNPTASSLSSRSFPTPQQRALPKELGDGLRAVLGLVGTVVRGAGRILVEVGTRLAEDDESATAKPTEEKGKRPAEDVEPMFESARNGSDWDDDDEPLSRPRPISIVEKDPEPTSDPDTPTPAAAPTPIAPEVERDDINMVPVDSSEHDDATSDDLMVSAPRPPPTEEARLAGMMSPRTTEGAHDTQSEEDMMSAAGGDGEFVM
ncbi:hypothetical protein HK101_002693, partial [Irineochytrium annulatum]